MPVVQALHIAEENHYCPLYKWQGTVLDKDPGKSPAYEVCKALYGSVTSGFVHVMRRPFTGAKVKKKSYPYETLADPFKMAAVLGSHYFTRENLYISTAVSRSPDSYRQDDILAVSALVIDVDYTESKDKDIRRLDARTAARRLYADAILSEVVPEPTYVEIGHRFKLVYVLEKPFVMPKKKRTECFTLLRRVVTVMMDKIEEECGDWGLDRNVKVAGYVRVPESLSYQARDFSYEVGIAEECSGWHLWNFDELSDTVLPELFDGYEEWKKNRKKKDKKKKPEKVIRFRSATKMLEKRLEDLRYLQGQGWDIGYREQMCYLYRLFAVQSGMTEDQALYQALEFNREFEHPLRSYDVMRRCKPTNYNFKYKDSTIRELLGVGDQHQSCFDGAGKSRHERWLDERDARYEKIASGEIKTKQGELEDTYETIKRLHDEGLKQKDIAARLGIPIRTIKRHYSTMRERGLI